VIGDGAGRRPGRRPAVLSPVEHIDPVVRLWQELPLEWRGPVIGPDIAGWEAITENGERRLDLTGLPDPFGAELAWMAHWQAVDGTRSSVLAMNQLANILRRAVTAGHPFPASIRAMDWDAACALQNWFYATRWGRLTPLRGSRTRLRVIFRFARLALLARCHDGPWWALDEWHPRCDPRIPLTAREPLANYGCSPAKIAQPWLREAVKWHLGTTLEAGGLRWTTVSQERLPCFMRVDRWLAEAFDDPRDMLGDPAAAAEQAAAFRHWDADPAHRAGVRRHVADRVHPRLINDDLRAVADLLGFVAANPAQARTILPATPWQHVTVAHAASWSRQVTRIPHQPTRTEQHYVDDHALAQIPAALPLLGLPRDEQMTITRGDGTQIQARGFEDPQAMRMILLQILTGRRASEIRTCDFDCLSPAPTSTIQAAGEHVARFTYAQSKIDIAPDSILVDREVIAVIEEQQAWLRTHLPNLQHPRFLFSQRIGNRSGDKPYPAGTYGWMLREFSDLVQITDSTRRPVRLSHTQSNPRMSYPFHCPTPVVSTGAEAGPALPRVVCGAARLVPGRRGMHGLPRLAPLARRTGLSRLRLDHDARTVRADLALRQQRLPQARLPDCGDDLPGHSHAVDGLVRRRLVHDGRPRRRLGVDHAEAARSGLVPDDLGDAAPLPDGDGPSRSGTAVRSRGGRRDVPGR
jgi:hypothetical protein